MNTYEELDFLFGKSQQAYLVTGLPFSEEAVVLYMNEAAARLLGMEKNALPGRTAGQLELAGSAENVRPAADPAGAAEGVCSGKYQIYRSDFGGDMCLCMLLCRGEEEEHTPEEYEEYRHKMEDALKAANEASTAKTKFLSEMSHDIRTPMNAIVGMTDIALNHTDDRVRVEDCLKKIQTASGHLLSLINEVLDMSRIESGKVTIMTEELQLADLIHSILIVIKPQAEKKGLHFHLELENIQYEDLVGDTLHLQQVYINILSNAVKFTPEGGDVWMHVAQEAREDGKALLSVRIQDNGMGMSSEFVERIFEPFEREQDTTTSKIEGTGLGMSIVKKIVEMMQGEIRVESEKGVGSVFTVRVPLEISGKEESFQREAFEGKRALVLQGAEEKLERLPSMLGRLGIAVDVAANGMEAIGLINEADISGSDYFALLTGDKLDDVEISLFLSEIRERMGSRFPILLFSESDWSAMEYLLKQAGVDSFVPLPLFESRLAQALFPYTEAGRKAADESAETVANYEDCHILLAEDNELNREIATEILRDTGALIDTAEDGREAVDAFAAKPEFYYDLILMDVQMPLMDGLEATRQIRKMKRRDASKIHIVAMTANAFVEDRKRSLEAGMNEHITKPLDVHQVLDCLDRWAGR
ncbi:MAG: ATP-binding protein [Eubacterium sp.]|nr:ATP-binding protein [Eubacterium sp.]MCM1303661.1 ATP-binding protein [Butyrivibrio sp.]MCM1343477.1 ATP-binding protein [Muribaculaceae bacterium]MCM1411111.1 ATP-binding protein [Lachnospiraceae bacterium]